MRNIWFIGIGVFFGFFMVPHFDFAQGDRTVNGTLSVPQGESGTLSVPQGEDGTLSVPQGGS